MASTGDFDLVRGSGNVFRSCREGERAGAGSCEEINLPQNLVRQTKDLTR